MRNNAVVMGYWRNIKYSVHSLIGAAEAHELLKEVEFYLVSLDDVLNVVKELRSKYSRLAYMQTLLTTELPSIHERLIQINKELSRLGVTSIAGGPHPTGDPFGTVLSLGFNYAFIGEVEDVLPYVIRLGLNELDPSNVTGIFYFDSGKFVFNGKGFTRDLNKYPPFSPALGLFNPVELSRGCFNSCKYCQVPYAYTSRVRHRSVESVLRWCDLLLRRGVRDLRFVTPDALSYGCETPGRVCESTFELLERLNTLKGRESGRLYFGTFPSEMRPEHVDKETARFLKEHVDNERINVGAQTGSDALLKKINRGHTSDDVIKAVEALSEAGFKVDVDYILGLPDDTPEDLEQTLLHMKEVVSRGGRAHIHFFVPLPGTPYALSNPSRVPASVRDEVLKLVGRGKAYGNWLNQERIAREVLRLRSEGVILATSERAHDAISRSLRMT